MPSIMRLRRLARRLSKNRSLRVTPDGVRFVLLTIGIGVAAINTGTNLLYLLFALMLSLIIMSGVLSEQCFNRVTVDRRLPPCLYAQQPASASFVIRNRQSRFPVFSLRVADVAGETFIDRGVHIRHLAPGGTAVHYYPLLVNRRGRFHLEAVALMTRFPFGLFDKTAILPVRADLLVYPRLKPLPPLLLDDLETLGQEEALPRRGKGTTLYNLRLYQPGDDSRSIHWKTTARKAQLILRETEAEDQRRVTLALPTRLSRSEPGSTDRFEDAVSLTASLCVFFIERLYEVRLLLGAEEVPYGMGEVQLHRLLLGLADCRPDPADRPLSTALRTFTEQAGASEITVMVLSWPDPEAMEIGQGVTRMLVASDYPEPA
ncbi:DUF58 domain-containing protein [Candidatus Nitrospira bockiana]